MTDTFEDEIESWLISKATRPEPISSEERDEVAVASLRPNYFKEYVGQEGLKETLIISCDAARARGDALDHLLLHGPPGLGKTSLARIVAQELGVGFKSTSGPVIEKPGDLAAILTSLHPRDVLFIDEIHRLPRVVEEVLYPAMEDYQIDILIGQGPSAKSIKIDLKPFTLVGATTRTGLLTSPLRDRFGIAMRLGFYTPDELQKIVQRSAEILKVPLSSEAAFEIGKRSRGTPRIANRLLKRVRDFAHGKEAHSLSADIAREALSKLNIDARGLDEMDRTILVTMIEKFNGGPVGVETIAAAIGEDRDTLEDVYEPYLLQEGLIIRTRRGREVTDVGYSHLNYTRPLAGSAPRQLPLEPLPDSTDGHGA